MMRALHVYSGNMYGGVERMLATLARERALCPALESRFALCHEGRLSRELEEAGVPATMLGEVRVSRPLSVLRARRALAELLARDAPDVVICHSAWAHALFAPVVRKANLPLVFWLHDFVTGSHWTERLAARTLPSLVIANSVFTARSASAVFGAVPVEVVHCPVTLAPPREDARATVRESLGATEAELVVLQLGRMESWKGHSMLLEAMAQLPRHLPWRCWLAGGAVRAEERVYELELRQLARNLGIERRVAFLGDRDDVPDLLAAADVVCHPSLRPEPFGIAIVEALAAGRAVVAARAGGVQEILDAQTGVLFAPGILMELRDALTALLTDRPRRRALGAAGPARAVEVSDPARQLDLLSSLLERYVTSAAAHT
ncbi:MAG: group 1 family glycosyl transferase [Gemmatimonadetes bacterium]|nr:group 1 family glycosyl transferase [Gemmatimonadota bacterium]